VYDDRPDTSWTHWALACVPYAWACIYSLAWMKRDGYLPSGYASLVLVELWMRASSWTSLACGAWLIVVATNVYWRRGLSSRERVAFLHILKRALDCTTVLHTIRHACQVVEQSTCVRRVTDALDQCCRARSTCVRRATEALDQCCRAYSRRPSAARRADTRLHGSLCRRTRAVL
jgi:hypothetical protein